MFQHLTMAEADPILGISEMCLKDPRSSKINLSIGIYKDENGDTTILDTVKRAETLLLDEEKTKNYLPIEGLATFNDAAKKLLLGQNSVIINEARAQTLQTPGGTGALKIIADFLVRKVHAKRIWVSNPTWPNHDSIFAAAGFEVKKYRYYDANTQSLDFDGMCEDLAQTQENDIVLFHGCCHNPTGIDPTFEQWQTLLELTKKIKFLPLFDIAYQGFANSLDEDAKGVRLFAESLPELLIASSFSKNFGLYNERIGALTLIAETKEMAQIAFSQMKSVIRTIYSNPPAHGAMIVSKVLNTPELYEDWVNELTLMRERIKRMRQLFVRTLQEKGAKDNFSFILQQNGMFSYSGLNKDQVARLRDEFAVYAVNSGRINIAGMTLENMAPLCEAIVAVL